MKTCNNKELYNFRYLLGNIYDRSVFYEHIADDYDHLYELKKQIKNVDVSSFGEIKKQEFNGLNEIWRSISEGFHTMNGTKQLK